MTADFPDENTPKKELETGRGAIGRMPRTAVGLGDGRGDDSTGGKRREGGRSRDSSLPVAAIFGEVEPEFIEHASRYVTWVDTNDIENVTIDIFITDLTIKEPKLERNRIQSSYGLTYGVEVARRITSINPTANVLFLINSEVCNKFSLLRNSRYRGLLLKSSIGRFLEQAIADVSKGVAFRDPEFDVSRHMEIRKVRTPSVRTEHKIAVQFVCNDPNLTIAKDNLAMRLRRAWFPPRVQVETLVFLGFTVDFEGRLVGLDVIQSSGNSIADEAAAKAIRHAAPFRDLPSELAVQVQFALLVMPTAVATSGVPER